MEVTMPFEVQPPPMADRTMSGTIISQLIQLEYWTLGNLQDARRDTLRFWLLKLPAILSSVSAGILAYLKWDTPALMIGAVGSLCVLIDGVYPSGMLRNVHLRAVHDIRSLQNKIQADWLKGYASIDKQGPSLEQEIDKLTAKIVKNAQKESERIACYLRDAETSLGTQIKSS
jgi:hypothetical protein